MARDRDLIPSSLFQFPANAISSFPSLWEEFGDRMSQWMGSNRGVTVSEDKDNIYVEADLPGLEPDNLDISLHKNVLVIQGEKRNEQEDKDKRFYRRAQRSFYYQVELPAPVEENSEQVNFQDGVLKVNFKKTSRSDVRKLSVQGKNRQGQQQQEQQQQKQQKKK